MLILYFNASEFYTYFVPALFISGIHKVSSIKFKGGYCTCPLAAIPLIISEQMVSDRGRGLDEARGLVHESVWSAGM